MVKTVLINSALALALLSGAELALRYQAKKLMGSGDPMFNFRLVEKESALRETSNSVLGYAFRPNYVLPNGKNFTNSEGFFQSTDNPEKCDQIIFLLGDSTSVKQEYPGETYDRFLEQRLSKLTEKKICIVNGAVHGYGLSQYAAVLEERKEYLQKNHIKKFFLLYCLNDPIQSDSPRIFFQNYHKINDPLFMLTNLRLAIQKTVRRWPIKDIEHLDTPQFASEYFLKLHERIDITPKVQKIATALAPLNGKALMAVLPIFSSEHRDLENLYGNIRNKFKAVGFETFDLERCLRQQSINYRDFGKSDGIHYKQELEPYLATCLEKPMLELLR